GFCAKKPGRPRSYLRSSLLIRVHLRLVFLPAFDTIPSRPSGNAASKSRVVPNGTPNGATNFGRRLSEFRTMILILMGTEMIWDGSEIGKVAGSRNSESLITRLS